MIDTVNTTLEPESIDGAYPDNAKKVAASGDVPVTDEQITAAIQWFKSHEQSIAAALPIQCPGTTYKSGSLTILSHHICQWESKAMPINLARAYIHGPLKRIKEALCTTGTCQN